MIQTTDAVTNFVRPDSYLTLHYRITLTSGPAAGSVFADTYGSRPATLQLGAGLWAPGLEAALVGRAEGEQLTYELPAAQAYGDRNPDLLQRLSVKMLRDHAGEDETLAPGDLVDFAAPNGGRYSGVLKERDEHSALFDFNHPLAGADLRIDVSLLGVL